MNWNSAFHSYLLPVNTISSGEVEILYSNFTIEHDELKLGLRNRFRMHIITLYNISRFLRVRFVPIDTSMSCRARTGSNIKVKHTDHA